MPKVVNTSYDAPLKNARYSMDTMDTGTLLFDLQIAIVYCACRSMCVGHAACMGVAVVGGTFGGKLSPN